MLQYNSFNYNKLTLSEMNREPFPLWKTAAKLRKNTFANFNLNFLRVRMFQCISFWEIKFFTGRCICAIGY